MIQVSTLNHSINGNNDVRHGDDGERHNVGDRPHYEDDNSHDADDKQRVVDDKLHDVGGIQRGLHDVPVALHDDKVRRKLLLKTMSKLRKAQPYPLEF